MQWGMEHKPTAMAFNDSCDNRPCHTHIQHALSRPTAFLWPTNMAYRLLLQCWGLSEGAKREWSLICPKTMILTRHRKLIFMVMLKGAEMEWR